MYNNYNNLNQINMMYQMSQMNNQFNPNNIMNTPMDQFYNNMMNNMFQMMNQMNLNNNQGMANMKIGDNNNEKQPKFLTIKVKMEDGKDINIQSKSDDKMELVINKFCIKADYIKEDYDFYVKGKKAKEDLTVEDNGIQVDFDYIYVIKKNKSDINDKNITNIFNNNNDNNINERKIQIFGKPIILSFSNNRNKVIIQMGLNNTFKDAVNEYCWKLGLSDEKNLVFLYNGAKISVDDRIILGQICNRDYFDITVIEQDEVIGA